MDNLCGAVQAKVWGNTQCIFKNSMSETHFLDIKEGGNSSLHCHKHKWNRFFIISGKLEIQFFDSSNNELVLVLKNGDFCDMPPGNWHKFNALTDVQCLETYWIDEIDHNDIERKNTGFTRESQEKSKQKILDIITNSQYNKSC
jgi:mannose-6-phosphate isomerase-like protein (cupin superfamily)